MRKKTALFIAKYHNKWSITKLCILTISFFAFYSFPLFNLDIHNSKGELFLGILKSTVSLSIIFYIVYIPIFIIELFLLVFLKKEKRKIFFTVILLILFTVSLFTAYNEYSIYRFQQELKER